MTNSEFYTKAQDILVDYISYIKVDSITMSYYAGVAAHVGIILIECSANYVPPKEFLFILRHHFSYKTSHKSTIKEAYRYFYRVFRELSIDLNQTLSDTVNTLRHQGYNTYE